MAHLIAPLAERDLDDIWHYIATQSGGIEIANRLIDLHHRPFLPAGALSALGTLAQR